MSTFGTLELRCDTPGCKNKISIEGSKPTKDEIYTKSRKAGWVWKSSEKHICPTHKGATGKTPKAKAVKTAPKASGKKVAKGEKPAIKGAQKVTLKKNPLGQLLNLDNPSSD